MKVVISSFSIGVCIKAQTNLKPCICHAAWNQSREAWWQPLSKGHCLLCQTWWNSRLAGLLVFLCGYNWGLLVLVHNLTWSDQQECHRKARWQCHHQSSLLHGLPWQQLQQRIMSLQSRLFILKFVPRKESHKLTVYYQYWWSERVFMKIEDCCLPQLIVIILKRWLPPNSGKHTLKGIRNMQTCNGEGWLLVAAHADCHSKGSFNWWGQRRHPHLGWVECLVDCIKKSAPISKGCTKILKAVGLFFAWMKSIYHKIYEESAAYQLNALCSSSYNECRPLHRGVVQSQKEGWKVRSIYLIHIWRFKRLKQQLCGQNGLLSCPAQRFWNWGLAKYWDCITL